MIRLSISGHPISQEMTGIELTFAAGRRTMMRGCTIIIVRRQSKHGPALRRRFYDQTSNKKYAYLAEKFEYGPRRGTINCPIWWNVDSPVWRDVYCSVWRDVYCSVWRHVYSSIRWIIDCTVRRIIHRTIWRSFDIPVWRTVNCSIRRTILCNGRRYVDICDKRIQKQYSSLACIPAGSGSQGVPGRG